MKILGYLFVIVLVLSAIGYVRGWFTVDAESGPGGADVRVGIDSDQAVGDARSVLNHVGAGGSAAEPGPAASEAVEGRITAVNTVSQDLTVEVASRTSMHHVASDAPITRDGARLAFTELQPNMRARFTFDDSKPVPILTGVVILP